MSWSLWRAFGWAFAGLGYAWRTQRNIRIHVAITLAIVTLAFWLGLSARDWAVLALTIGVVLAAEMANTAVEAVVDLVSPTPHPLAKVAKDTAAAGVLLAAIAAAVVGLVVLGPRLLARLLS